MRVGLYFHGRLPVRRYGGTQRVIVWLAEALAELGHSPVLLTPPGSRSRRAELHPLPPEVFRRAERDASFELDPHLPPDLDVVHFHTEVAARTSLPCLTTIHGNGEPGDYGPGHVFVSSDHMERMGGRSYVHNGLDPAAYPFRAHKGRGLVFLAKASRSVKGVDRAERIAGLAGRPLTVAGGRRFHPIRRFHPRRRVRSVGMIDDARKTALLGDAAALLFPILWEEPFGVAVIEALACGTPVVASPRGALPEIVTPDVGFLCDTDEEFVAALDRLEEIDPAACRERIERHFTARRMAEGYLGLYARAAAGELGPAT